MSQRSDTIAACATPPGRGGIAVVRVSGADAFAVAERLTGRPPEPGRVRLSVLRAPSDGAEVDRAVVLCFKGPNSYTGEDVVEFQCHGGAVTPRRVLEACHACGARPARRGEFTERAFLNGRLDLDQAESVLNLIEAKTVRAADAALEGLAGAAQARNRELYERALAISTELEHALDVDEGELPEDFVPRIRGEIDGLREKLSEAVRRAREGKILRDGALVVLAGPPNAGKSSLMNALLAENRAIVSDVPGTTRDAIEAWVDIDGWPVRLVDTAGLRETEDEVEAEGVRRAEELMARADLVLRLEDRVSNDPIAPKTLHLLAKCDLKPEATGGLRVSAKTGEGLDALRQAIAQRLSEQADASAAMSDASVATAACLSALALLDGEPSADLVLLANTMRRVSETLGEAIGATYSADLLDKLFSRFCVGK